MQAESQNLIWEQLDHGLQERRQQCEALVRQQLRSNRQQTLEDLLCDLDRANDMKTWWESYLPRKLQGQLRRLGSLLTSAINTSITNDLKWLQAQLLAKFEYSSDAMRRPAVELAAMPTAQKAMELSNVNALTIKSRLGIAAATFLAGAIFTPVGIGALVSMSMVAGLGADQFVRMNTQRDREEVRRELERFVARGEVEYASDIASRLKVCYAQMTEALKQHEHRWQQAEFHALTAAETSNEPAANERANWTAILCAANSLSEEIGRVLSAV
jgi:hypothetical protein